MSYAMKDGDLTKSIALPNGAAAVNTASVDVGKKTSKGALVAECELKIEAPVLDTNELPDTETMTYDVQHSADDSSWATLQAAVLVQTGAGGAGDAAADVRYRLPTDCDRYVRLKATNSGAGDASGVSATLSVLC